MCGIVGYIGKRKAADFLLDGLSKLEYRGYDSAGIAVMGKNGIRVEKCMGRLDALRKKLEGSMPDGTIGIGHTRWATHGRPSDANAHPHTDMSGDFVVVHNGIVENYLTLKEDMLSGEKFTSETDTEVVAHLFAKFYKGNMEEAVHKVLKTIRGSYSLVFMCKAEPEKIICTKKDNPLVVGLGEGENFIASDIPAIISATRRTYIMNDGEIAIVTADGVKLTDLQGKPIEKKVFEVNWNAEAAEKGGFEHFMLKEIFEQPNAIMDTFRGRATKNPPKVYLGGLYNVFDKFDNADRIIIVACGTSWHAGLVGEYLFEEYARIPVEVEYASEFRYRNPIINKNDFVIAISQSGETADTLAAIRLAKAAGATVVGICNVVGSSIPRETDAGVYTHAGPEIGVASTKSFTTQVTVLTMMALMLGKRRNFIADDEYKKLITELYKIPSKVEDILTHIDEYKKIAEAYKDSRNFIYLGRSYLYPVALEGALKLKEISYIHAEGYPAAEMKHGPIALIDKNMPVVVIATKDKQYEKVVSNVQEVKARQGIVIAVVTQGDTVLSKIADHVIEVPETSPALAPLTTVIPLQVLSYYIAVMRGCNVDQPRNLAKSVTVE